MQSYTIMYVLLCSLHSICRFLFNYSIKVIVVLTTFSIISIPYLLNSVLQPYIMPIYSIILLYLSICNMSHVLEINYLILSLILLTIKNYLPDQQYQINDPPCIRKRLEIPCNSFNSKKTLRPLPHHV